MSRLCLFFIALALALSPALYADRIYLNEGNVLRGKVISIGVGDYKFENANGTPQTVPKYKITKVSFSRGKSERGYERFFARALAGIGGAENSLTLSNPAHCKRERNIKRTPTLAPGP